MLTEIILSVTMLAMQPTPIDFPASDNTDWKPYEDYSCITDVTSPQYKLLQRADYEDNGLITIDGYVAVALGEAWGEIGDVIVFTLEENGQRHDVGVIIADRKQKRHTRLGAGWHGWNGHIIEAVVNTNKLPPSAREKGSVDVIPALDGEIVKAARQ